MGVRFLPALALLLAAAPAWAEGGGGGQAPAAKAGPVEKQVREILESFRGENTYYSDEPRVETIVAMGRAAIPPLMKYLREIHNREDNDPGFHNEAARDALARLAEEKDFDALAELLADGVLEASRALVKLRNFKVVSALLVPVRKGFVNWDYVEDLQKFGDRAEVRRALVEWMDKFGRAGGWEIASVARALGKLGVAEAIPVMKEILAEGKCESYPRVEIGKALVGLGDRAGVEALLDAFAADSGPGSFDHHRHDAGEALNKVVGERWYMGRSGPGERSGNFEEALEKFQAWWKKAGKTLRWDREKAKWVW